MADVLEDDCEFWLPSKFLFDDDSDDNNKARTLIEEDYLVGLTRQMSLNEFTENDNVFKSTLCSHARACGSNSSSQNNRSRLDLLYAAASREVARMRANNSHLLSQQQMLALLQLKQQLRQREMMMVAHMQQQNQPLGFGFGHFGGVSNAEHLGLSQNAWPSIHQAQQRSSRRDVFVGYPTRKKESVGTGVFLPRRVNTPKEIPPRKKPTVFVPAKVVQALNLNLEEMGVQTHFQPSFNNATTLYPFYNNGGVARYQGNGAAAARLVQKRSNSTHPAVSQEVGLPRHWTC